MEPQRIHSWASNGPAEYPLTLPPGRYQLTSTRADDAGLRLLNRLREPVDLDAVTDVFVVADYEASVFVVLDAAPRNVVLWRLGDAPAEEDAP